MSVTVNKNTTQQPMTAAGKTGTQVVKFIPAPRVYVDDAVADLTAVPVQQFFTKSDGTTPSGWTDLGTVNGNAKITYEKTVNEIRTGLDESLRAAYVKSKTAEIEFSLQQFDDVNLELLTGFAGSVISSGSIVNYQVGQEDVIQKSLLLVIQDKVTGKEMQFYNPAAYMSFNIDEADDGLIFKCTAKLPSFTAEGQTLESFFSVTEFA